MKILLLNVAPTLVMAGFASVVGLHYYCRTDHVSACGHLTLPGSYLPAVIGGYLLLGFAAGMVMAMIVRVAFNQTQARWAGRVLMLLGILAIPGAMYWISSSPEGRSGWEGLVVTILIGVLAAGMFGAGVVGFMINRMAFANEAGKPAGER